MNNNHDASYARGSSSNTISFANNQQQQQQGVNRGAGVSRVQLSEHGSRGGFNPAVGGLSSNVGEQEQKMVACPLAKLGEIPCRWYGPKHMLTEHLEHACFFSHLASIIPPPQNEDNIDDFSGRKPLLQKVKQFIMNAMGQYLHKDQIVFHCSQQLNVPNFVVLKGTFSSFHSRATKTDTRHNECRHSVWEIMENVNPQYFNAYHLRITLKSQMEIYNQLVEEIENMTAVLSPNTASEVYMQQVEPVQLQQQQQYQFHQIDPQQHLQQFHFHQYQQQHQGRGPQ